MLVLAPRALLLLALSAYCCHATAEEFSLEKTDEGVTVKLDGELFTKYVVKSGAKPILWPIIGPTGKPITRAYPMVADAPGEDHDHVHQRSFWFTHGIVDGIDFWAETGNKPLGTTEHREFVKVEGGAKPVIVTRNDWLGPDKKKHLEDERTVSFGAGKGQRWIDFDITLKADPGDVVFGDTKEGSFGMRVAESMRVESKLHSEHGHIVNSEGQRDKDAWAKRASWVDYYGPVDGREVGVAILNHPSSFRYPTFWHVRTYGLFAANPFGEKEFTKAGDGAYKLAAGKTLTFKYRVILHEGDDKSADIASAFKQYAGSGLGARD